jgi:hypothetical protein
MASASERHIKEISKRSQIGRCGVVMLATAASEITGPFVAVQALAEAVIDVSECTTNIESASNITIPAGVTIFGNFDSIELDSGTVLMYRPC